VTPAPIIDPHTAINQELSAVLGPGLDRIQALATVQNTSSRSTLPQQVLAQPLVHAVLSREDAFTLLQSPAVNGTVTSLTAGTLAQQGTVTYSNLSKTDIISVNTDNTLTIQIPASPLGTPGFLVTVPNSAVLFNADGTITVQVPTSEIPTNLQTGGFGQVYAATAPLLNSVISSGSVRGSPTAANTVPGLRLVNALTQNHNLAGAGLGLFLRMLRIAATRNVFTLTTTQTTQLNNGVTQFLENLTSLSQSGAFTPPVPPPAPTLVTGPLRGTLEVSLGTLRQLVNVNPSLTGLQLPSVGNFPGQIDIGYVFDRHGNYGIALTARGSLFTVPPGLGSPDRVAGDVGVEVSNAGTITQLSDTQPRVAEGITQGLSLSGGLEATNANGVATFGTKVGYGAGLEFGTGMRYTQVIPLGNVFNVIPSNSG
jgi:hypothetical protein